MPDYGDSSYSYMGDENTRIMPFGGPFDGFHPFHPFHHFHHHFHHHFIHHF